MFLFPSDFEVHRGKVCTLYIFVHPVPSPNPVMHTYHLIIMLNKHMEESLILAIKHKRTFISPL